MIDRGQIARAFSPARNVRALWERKPGHLAPLDGIRALAILWTILFHSCWDLFALVPPRAYVGMLVDPWMRVAWRGQFGVDVFFALSGFLIAGMLIDERERTGRLRLGRFYVRRLMRLWPALLVGVALTAITGCDYPQLLWLNALYISNFAPVYSMGWTWSLAIEEYFYLVCPWVIDSIVALGTRGRVIVLGSLLLLAWIAAAGTVIAGSYHAIDAEVVIMLRPREAWGSAFNHLYIKPWMRVGPLLMGTVAAVLHRDPRVMARLDRSGAWGTAALVIALVVAAFAGEWHHFVEAPRWLEVAYLASYRSVFGACVSYVILLVLSKHGVGRALGRVLAARPLYPIAQLAYAAYLVNPIVSHEVAHRFGLPLVGNVARIHLLAFPCELAVTMAIAFVIHVLVERPFMELRPRVPSASADEVAPRPLLTRLVAFVGLGLVLPTVLYFAVPAVVRQDATVAHARPESE